MTCALNFFMPSQAKKGVAHNTTRKSNSSTWTRLHVLSVRVGAVLEVSHLYSLGGLEIPALTISGWWVWPGRNRVMGCVLNLYL